LSCFGSTGQPEAQRRAGPASGSSRSPTGTASSQDQDQQPRPGACARRHPRWLHPVRQARGRHQHRLSPDIKWFSLRKRLTEISAAMAREPEPESPGNGDGQWPKPPYQACPRLASSQCFWYRRSEASVSPMRRAVPAVGCR